jgi:hypothetical protein
MTRFAPDGDARRAEGAASMVGVALEATRVICAA